MLWYLEEFISISKMPGWDGMGWDGKGREGMSWDGNGVGAGYHVEKQETEIVFYQKFAPGHHCGSLWAACGTLGAPVCVPFCHLGGYWCPLGPKLQRDTKIMQKWEPEGCLFSLLVG